MMSNMMGHANNGNDAKRLHQSEARLDEIGHYDVFISHRGPDTKTGFVGYLYDALKRAGLHSFLDCISIGKAQDSWNCIVQAIETTPLALVIFSENFAQSEWCLRELHAILGSFSIKVLPIFYKVQPWEVKFPEKGQLAFGFSKLVERYDVSFLEEWRADLKIASKLNGWVLKEGDKRLEKDLVLEVVEKIIEFTNKSLPLDVGDYIVGVKQVAQNLIQTIDEKNVLILGLWGMGGIGKSTLAKELYNQLERRFDGGCYVEDVVEKVNRSGVTSVQNLILKGLCGNGEITNKSHGKVILEERLSKRSIFLVLDDVCDNNDMDYLISRKMLKKGSMCIVTSRDRRVIEKSTSFDVTHEVYTHDVQFLNQQNSQRVFACHAFGGDGQVPLRFGGLVGDICLACSGVPLVLKVCGSLLKGEEDVEVWEEVLKKLHCGSIIDEGRIFECLWISYDALHEQHQEMFLDIACALLGEDVEMAKLVWQSQGWSAALGVRNLVEKALIRVDEFGMLHMHDHLRDMGRAIARQRSGSEGNCKRLWGFECLAFLNQNEGLPNSLRTLILPQGHGIDIDLSFLRSLFILKCEGDFIPMSSLPKTLRWLDNIRAVHSPSRNFPKSLENNELVILNWRCSALKTLPKSFTNLRKLKVLGLQKCHNLIELPYSFGDLKNLKNLNLEGSGIQSLPNSFGMLRMLKILNLQNCSALVQLPWSFGDLKNLGSLDLCGSGIQGLPDSFGMMNNLEKLNLGYCIALTQLPCSFGDLKNLKNLDLHGSGIQGLPDSFGMLNKLKVLDLQNCSALVQLPYSFGHLKNLENLDLKGSGIQCIPDSFGMLSKLKVLNLQNCSALVQLPYSFKDLKNLESLNLYGRRIQSLPDCFGMLSKLKVLVLWNCSTLLQLPHSFGDLKNLVSLNLYGSGIQGLPDIFRMMNNLEELNLGYCSALAQLPCSFGDLKNLKNLNLYGSRIQSLPDSFGMLSMLKVLDLQNCSTLVQLPYSFRNLKNLESLDLCGSTIESLPDSFGMLNNLELLNLQDCSAFVQLPHSFGDLKSLKNLNLDGSGIQGLPDSFGMLSKLKLLGLENCSALAELPYSIGDLKSLKNLDLNGSGIQGLPNSFGMLSKLKVLDLWDCSALVQLPSSFGDLKYLRSLDLYGSGIQDLPDSFGMMNNLEKLNLGYCIALIQLPYSFGDLKNLKNLDLHGSGIQGLPNSFGMLNKLKVLDLQNCSALIQLPYSFGHLKNLENLDLKGSGIQCIPDSFGMLSKLKVLDLEDCNALVELPYSFGDLEDLENLDLKGSGIQSLPDSFEMLSKVKVLGLPSLRLKKRRV